MKGLPFQSAKCDGFTREWLCVYSAKVSGARKGAIARPSTVHRGASPSTAKVWVTPLRPPTCGAWKQACISHVCFRISSFWFLPAAPPRLSTWGYRSSFTYWGRASPVQDFPFQPSKCGGAATSVIARGAAPSRDHIKTVITWRSFTA